MVQQAHTYNERWKS